MKKHIAAVISAILMIFCCISCNKDTEKNYNYEFEIESNIATDEPGAEERFKSMVDIIHRVDYLSTAHSYYGKYSNACQQMVKDFAKAYDELDNYKEEFISLFEEEDILAINAKCTDTGEYVAAGYLPKDKWGK